MSFFDLLKEKYGIDLDGQQTRAASHYKGPALVLAGPGSGKTTVIVSRLAFLVFEKGCSPGEILTMSFNRAAAAEMRRRSKGLFTEFQETGGCFRPKIRISTLHSFCLSVIRLYARANGMRCVVSTEKTEEAAAGADAGQKATVITVGFDGMLSLAYTILRDEPGILGYFRNRYRFLQVDEGQDMSLLQHQIVRILALPSDNIFIVADDDQSIYAFRGAEPGYIIDLHMHYKGLSRYCLERNYRSNRDIVEAAGNLISHNCKRYAKNCFTEIPGSGRTPVIIDANDEAEQADIAVREALRAQAGDSSGRVAILFRNNLPLVAVANRLIDAGAGFRYAGKGLDIAGHWTVKDVISMMKYASDNTDHGAFGQFYKRINVKFPDGIYEWAARNSASVSMYRDNAGHRSGRRGRGGRRRFSNYLLDNASLSESFRIRIVEMASEFIRMSRMKAGKAIDYMEQAFGYMEGAREFCDTSGVSFSEVRDMFSTLKIIAGDKLTLEAFIERIALLNSIFLSPVKKTENCHGQYADENTTNTHNLLIATVHAVKGLEFDLVIIGGAAEGEFPVNEAIEMEAAGNSSDEIEQERRLFYVAVTRAASDLLVIAPKTKNGLDLDKSRFAYEIQVLQRDGEDPKH